MSAGRGQRDRRIAVRIEIDHAVCTGHARCAAVAPALFALDDVGFGVLVHEDGVVPAGLEVPAELATMSCPERAILLHRD
jgi:ferredoxin